MSVLSVRQIWFAFCICWLSHGVAFAQQDNSQRSNTRTNRVDFVREIKPILSANCFKCHGPDEKAREADLRFDLDRKSFASIIGTVDDSDLLKRLTSSDPDFRMPPPDSNLDPLDPNQIRLMRKWIDEGALVAEHWSYQKVSRPPTPTIENDTWSLNPIDRFVLAKLIKKGLRPSARASYQTLIRRASLDLVGLPPLSALNRHEVNGDFSHVKYRETIEQLLASPAFGERMAIDWLDLVRYADTSGIHSDNPISMSPYRDYVIEAFNDDMPFDQFTREQLAGDLIPNASISQRIASAYNRLNMMTTEGGAQDKEYLAKYAADRVRTTSTVWLGSTLGCAECHDHKYDPFTSEEFYQFAAFFADITEKGYYPGAERSGDWGPRISVPNRKERAEELAIQNSINKLNLERQKLNDSLSKVRSKWIASMDEQSKRWKFLVPKRIASRQKTSFQILGDHSVLAGGVRPATDVYSIVSKPSVRRVAAIRVEVLPHDSLPKKGPGRAGNGNFVLTEIKCEVNRGSKSVGVAFGDAISSFDQTIAGEHTPYKKWHAKSAIDIDKHGPKPGWAILPQVAQANAAIFQLNKPIELDSSTELVIHLEQKHDNPGHVLGRFRLSVMESVDNDWKENQLPPSLIEVLRKSTSNRTEKDWSLIRRVHANSNPNTKKLNRQIDALQKKLQAAQKSQTSVLVTVARTPRVMRILPRGNWLDESGKVVVPGMPQFNRVAIGSQDQTLAEDLRLSRMDLADWMVDPDNPLTSRVLANRIWRKFFGRGLVESADDFGSQGSLPTHPELLDWLASELIESGWDQKHLMRLIVCSATYQQRSQVSQVGKEIDILNLLLSRQNSFRLEAEVIRDQALAASGLLVKEIGGRSVKPYQPAGYYRHLNFPKRTYQADQGSQQYRRGVYTHWQRLFLHPMMQAFDAPSREECTAQRVRSNTPQQALVLLNDPSFVEAAEKLATRILQNESHFQTRLQLAYQLVLGREPTKLESKVFEKLARQDDIDSSAEKQVWTALCRVILNLHEFTTRY